YLRPKSTLDDGFTRRLRRNSRVDIKQPMTYPADEACEVGAEHRLARLTGHGPLQLRLRARRRRLYAWFSRPTPRRWALSRRRRLVVDHVLPERIRPATRDQAPHADS